ncbi:hypothetical protein [Mycobacterium sp. AT1]|uniref:hypothetical protein n=1 Tax=Mycobacterium sp. AT1 TaxID=1961706 RepID=UPI00130205AA|nr:hypothetical protein [Mycobacterium sp. AT1]
MRASVRRREHQLCAPDFAEVLPAFINGGLRLLLNPEQMPTGQRIKIASMLTNTPGTRC